MIATGIFTGYYPMTIDETIAKIKKEGLSCVQIDVSFNNVIISFTNAGRQFLIACGMLICNMVSV